MNAPLQQAETVRLIPRSCLAHSPYQKARVSKRGDLQELANSMREVGILEPLIVRPAPEGAHQRIDFVARFELALNGSEQREHFHRFVCRDACAIKQKVACPICAFGDEQGNGLAENRFDLLAFAHAMFRRRALFEYRLI